MTNTTNEPGLTNPHGGSAPPLAAPDNSAAVVQLVVAGVLTLLGCFLTLPAAILGIVAVVQHKHSPARSAKLTRWGWIAFGVGVGLTVLAAIGLMVVAGIAATGND
jgi:hypothetical protein